MKAEIKYIFECKGGFKYIRDTKEDILQVVNDNYEALKELCSERKSHGDDCWCNMFLDTTGGVIIRGSITTKIDNTWQFYEIRTEINEIQ